jgi:hypothetical protein
LETGEVILPLDFHTIFVTFALTADDTTRTTLPKEARLALLSHKNLFFRGGLTLHVASSIPATPEYIFQAALLTMLSLEQTKRVPTPTERPRQGSNLITWLPPQGHAPWPGALMRKTPEDDLEGLRPPPLAPPLLHGGGSRDHVGLGEQYPHCQGKPNPGIVSQFGSRRQG